MDAEGLYRRLPVFLQQAACSLQGLRVERAHHGGAFSALLAEAEACDAATAEEASAWRDRRLRAMVRHCAATVPYYRRWFRGNAVHPRDIRTLDDLRALPVLSKAQVQAEPADFLSEAVPRRRRVAVHTSGTTGAGLRFATTRDGVREQYAVWWRYRRWHGLQRGTWCAYFGGRAVVPADQARPPFWRYDLPGRRILFSGYHLGPDFLRFYVDELRCRRPPWLHGYPSLLALFAAYVVEGGVDLGYEPRWVTTGAENLLASQAALIERAFRTRPRQHYGLAEAVANVSECERGNLHVDEDFAPVEFLPVPGVRGVFRILGSNMSNPATPLLRYDTGDTATLAAGPCACRRPGRIVAALDGRREDYVVLRNGARVGRLDHVFKDRVEVREAQIAQRRAGELRVRIVRGPRYTEASERALRREFAERLGTDTDVYFDYVDQLDRSPGGKLRFVVSEAPGARLETDPTDGAASRP